MVSSKDIMAKWPFFAIVLISLLSTSRILVTHGLPFNGDMSFPLTFDRWINHFFPLWNQHSSVSNYESIDREMLMLPLILLAKIFNINMEWFVKLFLFEMPFIVSGISMYLLSSFLLQKIFVSAHISKVIPLLSSILFMFSPWVLEQMQAPFYWIAYALTPLILLYFMKAIDSKNIEFKYIIYTAFLWTLASSTPHYTILTGLLLLFYFVFSSASDKKYIKKNFKLLGILILLYTLFNFYWIFPYIESSMIKTLSPGYVVTEEQVNQFSQNSNILNVLRATDQWIAWFKPEIYKNPLWILSSFLIPILSLSILLDKKVMRNKFIIFFSLLFLITVLIAMGANLPFYFWLIFNAPLSNLIGWIWRVPGKLSYLVWMIYALFTSVFLVALSNKLILYKKMTPHISRTASCGFILSLFFILVAPKVIAYLGFYYLPVEAPAEYYQLNNWLSNNSEDFKVLCLAPYEYGLGKNNLKYETSFTWNPDRIAGYIIPRSSPKPSLGDYHFTSPWKQYYSFIYPNIPAVLSKYLYFLNVKYLIYNTDIVGTENQTKEDIAHLENSDLNLVKKLNYSYVFENKKYAPYIFIPKDIVLTTGGLEKLNQIPTENGIIFLEQNKLNEQLIDNIFNNYGNLIYSSENMTDFILSSYQNSYKIKPFEYTTHFSADKYWSRISISNPYEGYMPWHSFLKWQNINDGYYLDYNYGTVFTFARNTTLLMPFQVNDSNDYIFYVRLLQNKNGGYIDLSLDGNKDIQLNTKSDYDNFLWKEMFVDNLKKGNHFLKLTNVEGTNAVNVIFYVPEKEFINYKQVIKNNTTIQPISNVLLNDGFEGIDAFSYWGTPRDGFDFNIDNTTKWSGNYSLKLTTNVTDAWDWSIFRSSQIIVNKGTYVITSHLKTENVNQTHIVIEGYNTTSAQWFQIIQCPSGIDGTNDWSEYVCRFNTEDDTPYVKINLNAGWSLDKINPANSWFDDLSIESADTYKTFYSTNIKNKTFSDVFLHKEAPATVSNYKEHDSAFYTVRVNASSPFMLAFAESYDPLWSARVDSIDGKTVQSEVIRPVPLYSVINGFYVNQTGSLEITIEYEPQEWFYIGAAVSITTLIASFAYLIYDWRRNRNKKDEIFQTKNKRKSAWEGWKK